MIQYLFHNSSPSLLYKHALSSSNNNFEVSSTGALISYSGKYTGRQPSWKHMVYSKLTHGIWWGPVNNKIDEKTFKQALDISKNHIFGDSNKVIKE